MPIHIFSPTRIEVPGNKQLDEYIGRVNTGAHDISVAHMKSPPGWSEPGQTPKFREITVVLHGLLRVEHAAGVMEVRACQAIITQAGEWVRYSTPIITQAGEWVRYSTPQGAEYIAICTPAFSPETVHRDETK